MVVGYGYHALACRHRHVFQGPLRQGVQGESAAATPCQFSLEKQRLVRFAIGQPLADLKDNARIVPWVVFPIKGWWCS